MTPTELLVAGRALIEPPGAWIQNEIARDKDGTPVVLSSIKGVCWCMFGALWKAAEIAKADDRADTMAFRFLRVACDNKIVGFNDEPGRTQAEVLAKFDEAIALSKVAP